MSERLLYAADDFPVFQNRMYDSAEAARDCPKGQIELVEDLASGLVRNRAFDPALVSYDANYQNEQAGSAAFRAHLDWARDLVLEHIGREKLIEVGCGKGRFLDMLSDQGAEISGFDPTYEGADPRIQKRYFGADTGISAKGIVLRHVLEHIDDPVAFLAMLRDANGGGGLIYIEVPCFDWICANRAWFDIFYEHVNYFRLDDFRRIFGRKVALGHCFGGQYLYVVGDLASLRAPRYDPAAAVAFPADFVASLDPGRMTPRDVIWGGASKGVIYALLRARAGCPVAGVIDINPAKQRKYLAGTGLRVSAPEELLPHLDPKSRIMVMNPNYTEEIKAMSGNAFTCAEVGA